MLAASIFSLGTILPGVLVWSGTELPSPVVEHRRGSGSQPDLTSVKAASRPLAYSSHSNAETSH